MRNQLRHLFWASVLFLGASAPQSNDSLPPIRFYTAPVATTYQSGQVTPLVRQADGSYTALQFGILSPFLKANAIANYQLQLLAGLPGSGRSGSPVMPTNAAGAASQTTLFADLIGDGSIAAVIPFQTKTPLVSGATTRDILVILAGPDLSFKSITPYTISGNISGILAADVNGDGILDLIVAAASDASTPGGIYILTGTGGGAFKKAVAVDVGTTTILGVAAADLNGDGKIDLIVTDSFLNKIFVALGNGDGTFKKGASYAVAGLLTTSVAVADLNGDGKPDAVAVSPGTSNAVSFLGNGDGTFRTGSSVTMGAGAVYAAIGDLNGDGIADLATADQDANTVSIAIGKGDGSFGTPKSYAASLMPQALILTDFNNDGRLDVVVGNGNSRVILPGMESWDVQVLLGNGDGTLYAAPSFPLGSGGTAVALGDFNGDGKVDYVTANQATDDVAIVTGAGGNVFGKATTYSVKPASGRGAPSATAAGDLNGDGKADIVVANTVAGNVAVGIGNGTGGFQLPVFYQAGSGPSGVAIADVNKDGRPDLIVSNFGPSKNGAGVSVLLAQGGGGFQAPVLYPAGSGPVAVATGDLNGDGLPDVVVVNGGTPGSASDPGGISILRGKADGTLLAAVNYAAGLNPSGVAIGDFNGDGKPDLAVATGTASGGSAVAVLLGNGDGSFRAAVNYATETGAVNLVARDFDLDGAVDLAVTHCCGSTALTILRGNGDGSFQNEFRVNGGNSPNAIAAGDLDGDGKPDLVVVDTPLSGSNSLTVLLNRSVTGPSITSVRSVTGGSTIAPNTWVEIKGTGLAPATRPWGGADFAGGQLPTQLNNVSVTINGKPAFVEYISPTQVNVLSPLDTATGAVQVVVTNGGASTAPFTAQEAAVAPGFFTFDGRNAAAVHLDGSYIGATSLYPGYTTPAKPGETILLFGAGFGQTMPALTNGAAAQSGSLPALPVIQIGGTAAQVQFAGVVSPGLYQFNVVVPAGLADGDQPLTAAYNGAASASGVVLTVQK